MNHLPPVRITAEQRFSDMVYLDKIAIEEVNFLLGLRRLKLGKESDDTAIFVATLLTIIANAYYPDDAEKELAAIKNTHPKEYLFITELVKRIVMRTANPVQQDHPLTNLLERIGDGFIAHLQVILKQQK